MRKKFTRIILIVLLIITNKFKLDAQTALITGGTSVCQNGASPNVTFTGASGTAPYTFTYQINGGANQTVTTSSGNSVTVIVPTGTSGSLIYSLVSVMDASFSTNGASGNAIININPLPTATISGGTIVCQNDVAPNVTFTGASGTAPYTFTYQINGGVNQTVITSSGNSATVPAPTGTNGTFIYSLVSIQDASSTACINAASGSEVMIVNPLPTATVSGTTSVCQNAPQPVVTFTGASGTAPYTFTYQINGGASQTVITNSFGDPVTVSVPTTTATTYTYTLLSIQDASSTLCSNIAFGTAVISVNPLPNATISGTATICQNSTHNVTFSSTVGTPPFTYTYQLNGGVNQTVTTSSGNSVTVQVPTITAATNTYTLISVQDGSSAPCINSASGSAIIDINPLPTATIFGTTSVCQNDAAPIVTFTGASGTAPYTFTYQINGGANQTVTTSSGNSVTVTAPTGIGGTFTYSLVSVMDASSTLCSNNVSGTAIIKVNPLPNAIISSSATVCQNASYTITFSSTVGTPPFTYTYQLNGGANQTVTTTGSGNSVTMIVPTASIATYTYTLVSVMDASSTLCSQNVSGTSVITIKQLPTGTVSAAGSTVVCQGGTTPLITFTGNLGTPPYTFTYQINGVTALPPVTTSSGNSVTIPASTTNFGTFTYSLLSVMDSSPACTNFISGSAVVITVNQLPTAIIAGTASVCQGGASPLITFTGNGGVPPYSFTYNINGVTAPIVTTNSSGNPVTVPASTLNDGTYTYTLVSVQDASLTNCSSNASGSAVITVNLLPTATISGATVVCQNSPQPNVTFTGASGTSPYTFTYKINGGSNQTITTSSGNSVTVPAPTGVAGTYTYSLVNVIDGSSTTCLNAASGSTIITVNPLPTATISGTIELCQNAVQPDVTFTGASGTSPYTFTYNINGGTNQTITTSSGNSVIVPAPTGVAGTYTYSLVNVIDGSSTTCLNIVSGSAVITVHPIPDFNLATSTPICSGEFTHLNLQSSTSASGVDLFTWSIFPTNSFNPFITGDTSNAVFVATHPHDSLVSSNYYDTTSIQYFVTVKSEFGCSEVGKSDTIITQIVNPTPKLTITSKTICAQESINIIPKHTDSLVGPVSYKWALVLDSFSTKYSGLAQNSFSSDTTGKINDLAIKDTSDNKKPRKDTLTYQYTLTNSVTGCKNEPKPNDNVGGDRYIVIVDPTPNPFVVEPVSSISYCEKTQHQLFNVTRDVDPSENFKWRFVNTSNTHIYQSPDSSIGKALLQSDFKDSFYVITSFDTFYACQLFSDTILFNANTSTTSDPRLIFRNNYLNHDKTLICLANNIQNASGYTWGRIDKATLIQDTLKNEFGQEYRFKLDDDTMKYFYWVEVKITGDNCVRRIYWHDTLLVGTKQFQETEPINGTILSLYPNPTDDILNIKLTGVEKLEDYCIEIYDFTGKIIRKKIMNAQVVSEPVNNLTPGLYLVACKHNGQNVATQKFIKY